MLTRWSPGVVDWSGGVFAGCITRVQLYVNACNWMTAVWAAAPLALPINYHYHSAELWRLEVARSVIFLAIFGFFSKVYMATPIDIVVFNCREIFRTGNRWNRELFTLQKKTQTAATARIALKICQGQPPIFGWIWISSKSVHFRRSYCRTREGRLLGP